MTRFRINKELLERLSPAERRKVELQIAALAEAHKRNPLYRFRPHARQEVFLKSTDKVKAFLGGNRAGKTTVGVIYDILQCIKRESVPPHLLPYKHIDHKAKVRVVVPDLTRTLQGVLLEKFRDWTPQAEFAGGSWDNAFDKRDLMLYFENGSFVQFMSHSQPLGNFQGIDLDLLHWDEEPPEIIRRENQVRLIDRNGIEMLTMTPLSGMTWAYEGLVEPWEKQQPDGWSYDEPAGLVPSVRIPQGQITVVTASIDDNPFLNPEARDRIINDPTLSEEERQSRKNGRFISFAGLVYGNSFDKDRNVIPDVANVPPHEDCQSYEDGGNGIPEGADVYVGIDPGLRHMAAVVWCYLDWRDELVVFDELAMKDQTIDEVCKAIHLKNADWRVIPRWYVIDPASRNRTGQTGRSDQMEYADHGIYTIPGQNAVPTGINRVKARFENVWRPDAPPSAPKLFITARCITTLDQVKKYRWAAPSRSEDEARERPVKSNDHLLDALRYLIMSRPAAPARVEVPQGDEFLAMLVREELEMGPQGTVINHPNGPGIFA